MKRIKEQYRGRHLIQKKVCMTQNIGVHGNLFGGDLLRWLDEAAAAFVSEATGFLPMVTLKISEVIFYHPVKVNDIINIDAEIIKIGNSSVTLKMFVVNTHTQKIVCTTSIVFVHVDENMKPKQIK